MELEIFKKFIVHGIGRSVAMDQEHLGQRGVSYYNSVHGYISAYFNIEYFDL
jgi:hypothetical protein